MFKEIINVTNTNIYLKPVITDADLNMSLSIRKTVFCDEQQIDIKDEFIPSEDKEATAFLIYLDNQVIGTIRYRIKKNQYKFERFAILKQFRGFGYGKSTMIFLSDLIGNKFAPTIVTVNAQIQVKELYEKCGFRPVGELFEEAGIKHIKMIKTY